jgi:hypothetical protein
MTSHSSNNIIEFPRHRWPHEVVTVQWAASCWVVVAKDHAWTFGNRNEAVTEALAVADAYKNNTAIRIVIP